MKIMISRFARSAVFVIASVSVAAFCTSACKKSSEEEKREVGQAETHSAELTQKAQAQAIDEKNQWLAAVRREQLELKAHVQEDVDKIDKRLMELKVEAKKDGSGYDFDPKSNDLKEINDLLQKRKVLETDMSTIDRSDERGWDETKANIERHLSTPTGSYRRGF